MNILFVGLGNMGLNMAKNLSKKSPHRVFGLDSNPKITSLLKSKQIPNVHPFVNIDQQKIDFLITMLPDYKILKTFYNSPEGPLNPNNINHYKKSNTLFIDSSTIGPQNALNLHKTFKSHGLDFVDAPVSGGKQGAIDASLTFMVGAKPENFKRAEPILRYIGKDIKDCQGPSFG